jgi:hypothetical protein
VAAARLLAECGRQFVGVHVTLASRGQVRSIAGAGDGTGGVPSPAPLKVRIALRRPGGCEPHAG